ncbi:bifunctional 2-C-methyl-D-erythritol 4-phosphate cytidylyltransferase/2-C-methyl-D-erythritol 2,4-cyclodiphosphate synthase [Desulfofundulus thermosubterraneus]|uniref:Bifunctional enzyme IspD/IspF n=1 Tax=Desulfofundulus thermosubterraneus DSM 16057 TaxID=1121432 RepID=A0A1M6G339_9FIRM|nr:bifunctional 2-C-methyl-D-erythritol 4-phosphate cytidylyltransferase/2-C-methyl-D-erythritol 2,4-cyclodiphosphate synthase [Desulfofundulus thermosubterraneus]SHJ04292.1 2-C-methyl-D-erythritol 2,4-cyclodiphosphate synthase [Desulfofundulus thermosubterraneus DSM 16057]
MDNVFAVVVAAGRSERMGGGVNKQFLPLSGLPVLARSLGVFEEAVPVKGYVLVMAKGEVDRVTRLARREWGCRKLLAVVPGGERRQDSVRKGLEALPAEAEIVLVHDGARPLVGVEELVAVASEAARWGAATLAVPVKDTVKEAGTDGFVVRTLPRESLWLTQTPQGFRCSLLREAHQRAEAEKISATDDASLVEALGHRVKLVPGSYRNIKITTPEDLAVAEALLGIEGGISMPFAPLRVGLGYDVHRLVAGRPLILGGVNVPFDQGLEGHSDADVLVHAVMDALLGAAGQGDIGRHFPDRDPQYAGISSLLLLERVGRLLAEKGFAVNNIDAVVVAQAPQLAAYIPSMEFNIARSLNIDAGRINVKATTTEGLGFTGTGEGIAAYAVAAVVSS